MSWLQNSTTFPSGRSRRSPGRARAGPALDLGAGLLDPPAQPIDHLVGHVKGVVDVGAAAPTGEADLLGPQPQARSLADQVPVASVAALAVQGLFEPEHVAVEAPCGVQVRDLEDQFGDSADGRRRGRLGHRRSVARFQARPSGTTVRLRTLDDMAPSERIVIRGAREHNLKDVDLELPRNSLIVITGLSGSGSRVLAFDTIYAEGQRRYVESSRRTPASSSA